MPLSRVSEGGLFGCRLRLGRGFGCVQGRGSETSILFCLKSYSSKLSLGDSLD